MRWFALPTLSCLPIRPVKLMSADMPLQGLGKTVQIISFLSILFAKEHCLPFLVVVRSL